MRTVVIRRTVCGVLATLLAGCTSASTPIPADTTVDQPATSGTVPRAPASADSEAPTSVDFAEMPAVSVLLVGDVMLGRGVASIVRDDPSGLFEDVRHVVGSADISAANLESPLTLRPHLDARPFALEADPAAARSLATAGFDLVGIANNHSGDAGRLSILDTIEAVEKAGMAAVGGGEQLEEAYSVQMFERNGLKVGFAAFDATRAGTSATGDAPGIAHWDEARVRTTIEEMEAWADLVIVGLHGGVEHYRENDPGMAVLGGKLAGWGVDIVWGHGSHVTQPVYVTAGTGGRPTIIATSLGNFLFDQSAAGTQEGAVLEVLADRQGVLAYREGTANHHDRRVHFDGWAVPKGDAVLFGLEWWNLVRTPTLAAVEATSFPPEGFTGGDVVAAAAGDATGDGRRDVVISHRRPYEANDVNRQFPNRQWADADGRSAHLGVYRSDDLREVWVAGTLFRPVARLAVCDGSIALAFDSLDDSGVLATGGWVWQGFGFTVPAELAGPGTPGCSDVDGDGSLDPVILDRK